LESLLLEDVCEDEQADDADEDADNYRGGYGLVGRCAGGFGRVDGIMWCKSEACAITEMVVVSLFFTYEMRA
jgi:hypothetical protein